MIEHRSPISGVDTFGDRWVASAGYDNQLILWNAKTKRPVARVYHDHYVNQCRFDASGDYLVSASSDYTARLWSVSAKGLRLAAIFRGHDDDVEMAVISPSGRQVATASRDHTVRTFDLDGKLRAELHGHRADVISVEWTANGRELISSSDDGTVRRWDAEAGNALATVELGGAETDTLVSTEQGQLFAGNDEGKIIALDAAGERIASTEAHTAGIKRLALQRGTLLSASYDRTFKLWSVQANGALELLQQAPIPSLIWARSCAFLGRSRIVFGTFGSSYASYDLETKAWELSKIAPTLGLNAVRVVDGRVFTVGDAGSVHADGTQVAEMGSLCNFLVAFGHRVLTGGQVGALFDARTGETLYQHRAPLNCGVAFLRDGCEHLIVGTYTGEALVFRRRTDESLELVRELRLHDNAVKGVAASGSHLFSVCASGAAAFFRIDTLEPVARIAKAHDQISNGSVALEDGRFASVSRDRQLRLWTVGRCEQVIATPHTHSVKCVAASAKPAQIATGAYDGTIAVYDLREERWVHEERPTAAGISSLCAIDRGFLASSYDGQVYRVVTS